MVQSMKTMIGVIGGMLIFASTALAGIPLLDGSAAIPEPATLTLLAIGGGGLYFRRRTLGSAVSGLFPSPASPCCEVHRRGSEASSGRIAGLSAATRLSECRGPTTLLRCL